MSTTTIQPPRVRGSVALPRPQGPALDAALARAVEAFREGRAAQAGPAFDGPSDMEIKESAKKSLRLGTLAQSDWKAAFAIEAPREQALAHARAGRLDEAEATMRVARFLLSLSQLTPAGRAYAETMLHAAESYLPYRRGDFADAYARMRGALEWTVRLGEWWGNSEFIVCRRADMTHNLMKVDARRGAAAEAMELGAAVLDSVCAPTLPEGGDALDPSVVAAFCNLVVGTVAEVLAPLSGPEAAALLARLDRVRGMEPPSPRAWQWLAVKDAAVGGAPLAFVAAVEPFLRAGRGRTPALWYAAAADLVPVLRRHGHAEAGDEIARALADDPAVPAALRPRRQPA